MILTVKLRQKFAQAVNDFHKDYNVCLIGMSDLDERGFRDNNWKQVVVEGEEDDLIRLNKHCAEVAYGGDFEFNQDFNH